MALGLVSERTPKPIKRAYEKGRAVYATLSEHKFTTIAGTLVFFLILSFVPFLFWLVLLFGSLNLNLTQILQIEVFEGVREIILFFHKNAEGATTGISLLFLATTLWSSTSFFYHLRKSGEIIYHYQRAKQGWKVRISAFLFTFLLLFCFAAVGAVLVGATVLAKILPKWLYYFSIYALILAFGFIAAWGLNLYICPYKCKASSVVKGSVLTAVAWLGASVIFSFYMRFSSPERLYGALSLVIVFLLWLYWLMICFTTGVIYNCVTMSKSELEHKKL